MNGGQRTSQRTSNGRTGAGGGPGPGTATGGPRRSHPPYTRDYSGRRRTPTSPEIYRRRRIVAGALALVLLAGVSWGVSGIARWIFGADTEVAAKALSGATTKDPGPSPWPGASPSPQPTPTSPDGDPGTTDPGPGGGGAGGAPGAKPTGPPAATMPLPSGPRLAASSTWLRRVTRLTADMTPKSVVASHDGLIFAQNMMYRHTISVWGADGTLRATIPDSVDLAKFGIPGHPGVSRGAPVEMAFTPDGKHAWVSNYAMYGTGFGPEGKDACTGPSGLTRSFAYEIDTNTHTISRVVPVGMVPKYVAVTPDGSRVLVTNWCSMDLTVIDALTARVIATIPTGGQHPRGIAVSPDSRTAYVALMGSDMVVAIELSSKDVRFLAKTGDGPRHLVLSKDGSRLFVTNNGSGTVVVVNTSTGAVLRSATVGKEPRSMAVSSDGTALYVVNYASSTLSKLRSSDLAVLQTVTTDGLPIGVTYEPTRQAVWVASYAGSISVFDDSRKR